MAGDDRVASRNSKRRWPYGFLLSIVVPVAAAILLYAVDTFDPAPLSVHESNLASHFTVSAGSEHILRNSTFIGSGKLLGPEDIAYDPEAGVIYTACMDGWVKRIRIRDPPDDSEVENWVRLGGRPLGVALGRNHELIVAHPDKGLLNISRDGVVEVLTDKADGVKFKLTDGVDVAADGMVYFTDASSRYGFHSFVMDMLEGRPHGRLLSYDPSTKRTRVLLGDLYFANGVALSPAQDSLIFCETTVSRCRRYHLRGEKRGTVGSFMDGMPSLPDNVRYDGEGLYWIGLAMESTPFWKLACRFPFIRKVLAVMEKYGIRPDITRNGGVLAVDVEGNPVAQYRDMGLSMISSGFKIGNRVFCGSVLYPHLITFNFTANPSPPLQSAA